MISKEIVSFGYAESQSQKHLIVAIKRFSSTDLYELMCIIGEVVHVKEDTIHSPKMES